MKAVLLAAGRSFRMDPIEDKNFLLFCGKPLVVWQLEMLKIAGIRETFVVGGKHNLQALKSVFVKGMKVTVVEQKNLDEGMAGAVLSVKRFFKETDPMLAVSSNDAVDSKIFQKIIKEAYSAGAGTEIHGAIVAKKTKDYFPGGYLVTDRRGFVKKIVEKPGSGKEPSDLINLVIHLHLNPKTFFDYLERTAAPQNDRYEKALSAWMADGARFRAIAYDGFWQPVKFPWHALSLMHHFSKFIESGKPKKARSAIVRGEVMFGKGVKIFDHAVIQGPCYIGDGAVIGNNALVRESHIGAGSVVGFGSEVCRSYLGENVWLHTNYIGDSVIGNNVSFGAGTVTGNLRLDEGEISVAIKKEKIDSGLKKLGLITGNNIRVGINTSFMPGVKLGSNSCIGPGIVVAEDVPPDTFITAEWKMKKRSNKIRIASLLRKSAK